MKKVLKFTLFFFLLQFAETAFTQIPTIAEIKKRGVLRIAVNSKDTLPFFYKDKSGALKGSEIELSQEVCKELGVKPKFIRTTASFNNLVNQVANDEADLAISWISITPDRSEKAYFSQAYMQLEAGILVNYQAALKLGWKDNKESFFKFLTSTKGKNAKILSETGSWHSRYIDENFSEASAINEEKWEKRIPELLAGKITCIIFDGFILQGILRKHPELHLKLKYENIPDIEDFIGIAVNPKLKGVLPWLNNFLTWNRHRFFVDDVRILLNKLEKIEKNQQPAESFASEQANLQIRKKLQILIALACLIIFSLIYLFTMRYADKLCPQKTGEE
jgi:ABC-type amino acid transport substrate-binding protein